MIKLQLEAVDTSWRWRWECCKFSEERQHEPSGCVQEGNGIYWYQALVDGHCFRNMNIKFAAAVVDGR